MSEQQGVMPMVDYLILLLQKMFDAFLTTLASKLAERLAASKDAKTRKKPSPPRRRKQKGDRPRHLKEAAAPCSSIEEFQLFDFLRYLTIILFSTVNKCKRFASGLISG